MAGGAAAAENSFSAEGAATTTPDGKVSRVFMTPTGGVSWENFDEDVAYLNVKIDSRVLDVNGNQIAGWTTAFDQQYALGEQGGLEGSFENQTLGEIGLYGGESGNAVDIFNEADDGGSQARQVNLSITVDLLNGSKSLADPTDVAHLEDQVTFTIEVTNAAASSGASGTIQGGVQ